MYNVSKVMASTSYDMSYPLFLQHNRKESLEYRRVFAIFFHKESTFSSL